MFQGIPASLVLAITPFSDAVAEDAPTRTLAQAFARVSKSVGRVLSRSGRVTAEYHHPELTHQLAA